MNSNTIELKEITELDIYAKLLSKGYRKRDKEVIMILCGEHDVIKGYLEQYNIGYKYCILAIERYDEDIYGENVILTSNNGINFEKIRNSHKRYCIVNLNTEHLLGIENTISIIMKKVGINNENNYIDDHEEFSKFLDFHHRSPIDVVFSDTEEINKSISLVTNNIYQKDFVKKDTILIFKDLSDKEILLWQLNIQKELFDLEKNKVLQFTLAKTIFQIVTYDDYVSDELILFYYKKFLGTPNDRKSYTWNIKGMEKFYE